jgi:EAL domain-containing protein (putative c-di-GMP-specific phosphodiesterase class I)
VTEPPASVPPRSKNRLSDAPSAGTEGGGDRADFCGGKVKVEDLSTVFQPIAHLDDGKLFAYETLVRCAVPGWNASHALRESRRGAIHRKTRADDPRDRHPLVRRDTGVLQPSPQRAGPVRPDDPLFSHDHDICLEITESVPSTYFDLCRSVLREVCGRVVAHLVIDDLGAGYSNLKLIADLEPKVVKLDRAVVRDLRRKPRHQKLVSMVVRLCGELGAAVVAEGIETPDELSAGSDSGAQVRTRLFIRPTEFPHAAHHTVAVPLGQRAADDSAATTARSLTGHRAA